MYTCRGYDANTGVVCSSRCIVELPVFLKFDSARNDVKKGRAIVPGPTPASIGGQDSRTVGLQTATAVVGLAVGGLVSLALSSTVNSSSVGGRFSVTPCFNRWQETLLMVKGYSNYSLNCDKEQMHCLGTSRNQQQNCLEGIVAGSSNELRFAHGVAVFL